MMNGEIQDNPMPGRVPEKELTHGASYYDTETGKPMYSMTKKDTLFCVLAVVLSFIGLTLTLWGGFHVGFTVSYVLLFALMTAHLKSRENKPTVFAIVCGVLSLALSGVFALINDFSIRFFSFACVYVLGAEWFASLAGANDPRTQGGLFVHILKQTFGAAFGSFNRMWNTIFSEKNQKMKGVGKGLLALICSIPVIAVLILLLQEADMAFEGLLNRIGEELGTWIGRLILTVLAAPLLISYGLALKKRAHFTVTKERKGMDNVYLITFLGVISAIYVLYLFSQLAYFTDAFSGLLPDGFLPAEYARRGFFELCWIAAINLAVQFTAMAIAKKNDGKRSPAVTGECLFISAFTLFLISTAIAKMVLYVERFGMTGARVTASAFMIFLAVVFLSMIVHCFRETPVLRVALVAAACVLLVLGYGNMNKRIAQYNIRAYEQGSLKTLDVYAIYDLGDDAVEELYGITQNEKMADYHDNAWKCLCYLIRDEYQIDWDNNEILPENFDDNVPNEKHQWGEWSLTESKKEAVLRESYETLRVKEWKERWRNK